MLTSITSFICPGATLLLRGVPGTTAFFQLWLFVSVVRAGGTNAKACWSKMLLFSVPKKNAQRMLPSGALGGSARPYGVRNKIVISVHTWPNQFAACFRVAPRKRPKPLLRMHPYVVAGE